jgi:glycosyltransferase involved in cell wall biosynthesis
VPFGNRQLLADTILELLHDPALCRRLGAAARRKVARRFALSTVAMRHYDLYRELLGSDSTCPAS